MAIENTYIEYLTEQIIKEILEEGEVPTVFEIRNRLAAYDTIDLSKPQFDAGDYTVAKYENSSASQMNSTNNAIQQDLVVAYKHLFKTSDQILDRFERWRSEADLLENRLNNLQERICSLLLLTEDTEGYFNFVQESFGNLTYVDLDNTNVKIDVKRRKVSMGSDMGLASTRQSLNTIDPSNVEFVILTKRNLVSSRSASQSTLANVINDANNYWQEIIYMNKPGPVSVEVKIKLGTEAIQLSRIDVDLHTSNSNATTSVTPMYSTDNYNYTQLPISDYTKSILDKDTFQFSPVSALWIKLILTKAGHDLVHNGLYAYEFGIDEVALYDEDFDNTTAQVFVSKPLSIVKQDGSVEEFSKVALEATEQVPTDTSISYYVAASNDSSFDFDTASWTAIDPANRANPKNPLTVNFGDLSSVTVSGIKISHDPLAGSTEYINPAQTFRYVSSISSNTAVLSLVESGGQRYSFLNSSDRILDYELHTGVSPATRTLEVWRNVCLKGGTHRVRDNPQGWGFSEPYYSTTVYVSNSSGVQLDFGDQSVVVDGAEKKGLVTFSVGKHTVKIHKNNYLAVVAEDITTLAELKAADTLYPYNHKYLIEGFLYPSGWATTEEKAYRGFDIVAEFLMQEVSIFDIIHNVGFDYGKFARDLDAKDTGATIDGSAAEKPALTSFVLKVDESNPDFLNEWFTMKFKNGNTLYSYLRLKAEFATEDSDVTPYLSYYRLKVSS